MSWKSECTCELKRGQSSIYHKGICKYSQMNTFTTLLRRVRRKRNNLILKIYPQHSRNFCSSLFVSTILLASLLLLTFSLLSTPFCHHFCSYYPHILFFFTPLKLRHWSPFKVQGLLPSCIIILCPAVCLTCEFIWLLAFPLCCCFRAEMSSGGGIVRKAGASSYQGTRLLKIWRGLHVSTVPLPVCLRLPKSPWDLCRDCWLLFSVEVRQVCSLSVSLLHLELQEADNVVFFHVRLAEANLVNFMWRQP